MSNLKEIKNRIKSIKSIIKITNTMKIVSSLNFKKFKNLYFYSKLYYNNLYNIIKSFYKEINFFYKKKNNSNNILYIIITSNKGLCGNFNSFIIKNFIKKITPNKNIFIFNIGNIGKKTLSKIYNIYDSKDIFKKNIKYKEIYNIVNNLIKDFFLEKFNSIKLVVNNDIKNQKFNIISFLPIKVKYLDYKKSFYYKNYIIEPNKEEFIKKIFHNFLISKLYFFILKSYMLENKIRMITMHKSEENSNNIKNNLLKKYNKNRKESITNSLLEIINGYNSIK
ncbi:F0F1 ATP synthase subunit gamma [Candidatus Shikimatogenerans silvanidophilus]|uniref:F0F1 ATP synthase subunit gamma n=1 Tax=Candidatus Shikimatogenerans silvanidophilus TaxID=2782547 RepID=UPI001BAB13C2|nr:F0F1 ATP synthase subunit gamma [Candidatus Shikimatogenerans silvanidophilus]